MLPVPDFSLALPSGNENVGLIAQDVQAAVPEAIRDNGSGYLFVNNDPIFWTMLNAIKELKEENEKKDAEIEALRVEFEHRLARLEDLLKDP